MTGISAVAQDAVRKSLKGFTKKSKKSKMSNEAHNPTLRKGVVMPSCLRLSLKTKWFEMTNPNGKTEDYREINDYWCRRLLELDEETETDVWNELIEDLANPNRKHEDVYQCLSFFGARFKRFDINTMTLGYPKFTDKSRIKAFEHKGIEIRTGNPEWGAEPNKLYFVIMHGAVIV